LATVSEILIENGLPDRPMLLIEPHRNNKGVWRIKFSYEGAEPLSMAVGQASIMASGLRNIGEIELAEEIELASRSAARFSAN
jgi:hypothetical protein